MKFTSSLALALALATALLGQATAAPGSAASSSSTTTTTTTSSSKASLRGATGSIDRPEGPEDGTVSTVVGNQQHHRHLQRPDETCYTQVEDADDTTIPGQIDCTPAILGRCNNVPACAAYQQDAINFGSAWCSTWTVWNNEEPTCQWQYMCCN